MNLVSDNDRLSHRGRAGDRGVAPGPGPTRPAGRSRFGLWIAGLSVVNVMVAVIAIVGDQLSFGLIACSALSVASIVLVFAELADRRRRADGQPPKPRREREPFFRPW